MVFIKETKNKTSFPLRNIHHHQIEHIRGVIRHKGISFLIIKMNGLIYLLEGTDFLNYIDSKNRASIEYNYIKEKGHLIKEAFIPALDYLKTVDKIYFKERGKSG